MAKVTVDGIAVEVPDGCNILQACDAAGVEVPRFCYHERLSIAGNCRMCSVENAKYPGRLVTACVTPVRDGMEILTNTPAVKAARHGMLEFLLINHPLDCPICDQGGECDLQDEALAYGRDYSRFREGKRAVREKDFGPLVGTAMTRCIQCTRCVRFCAEIAGVPELGAFGRGEAMEIDTYVEKALSSELSGNLADICPVGALTAKPYAFVARSWELRKIDSIDVFDAVGAAIRVDSRGPEVLRVVPRLNEEVNEEWLADKGRFAIDGLKRRRLDGCWVRRDGALVRASWPEAFAAIGARLAGLDGSRIGAVAGDLACAESMLALKDLMTGHGSVNLDCRQDGAAIDASRRDFYLFNPGIAGIEEADALLIVGSNPRREAPLLNARIRKRWLHRGLAVGVIGPEADLTYPAETLGSGPQTVAALLAGQHRFAEVLKAATRPLILVGQGALARPDGSAVLAACWQLAAACGALQPQWHGFGMLHTAAARVGALDLGFLPGAGGKGLAEMLHGGVDLLWLLGADEFDSAAIGTDTFVVYQGSHGDRGAARADVILPQAAYTEQDGTYVNTEGRVQRAHRAVLPPGEAREGWKILRAFSAYVDRPLPYDDLPALRERLARLYPVFAVTDTLGPRGCPDPSGPGCAGPLDGPAFVPAVSNYYQTDPISRASPTMAECVRVHAPKPAPVAE
jgi:NADH-quinone oxidoreductase subunit G